MTTTYILKGITSDLGGGVDFNLLLQQGAGIPNIQTVNLAGGATQDSYGFTGPGDPGVQGITGNYTIDASVDPGNTNIQLSVSLQRVNSVGVVQNTSAFSLEQTCTAGFKTFNFPTVNLGIWAAGDRLRVTYRFRNTVAMMSQVTGLDINGSSDVIAPWTFVAVTSDLLLDICGTDLARVDKWSQAGVFGCATSINSVDDTTVVANHYGLVRYQKGFNDSKVYYEYHALPPGAVPCECTPSQPAPCAHVSFGYIDPSTCTRTQLLGPLSIPWEFLFYWSEFFGVDHNDNMYLLCNYGCPTPNQYPPGTEYRRLIKVSPAGAILLDTTVYAPSPPGGAGYDLCDYMSAQCQVRFSCDTTPQFVACSNSTTTTGPSWLSIDDTKIVGLGTQTFGTPNVTVVDEPNCSYIGQCTATLSYIVWSIDTSSGAFTILGSRPAPPTPVGTLLPTNILGNQILRYPDGSVVVFQQLVRNGANSYIYCEHWSDTGTLLSTFNITTGLATDIAGITDPSTQCSVSADVSDTGVVYLRLDYHCNTLGGGLCGRSKIYSTSYPLSAISSFTFVFDAYALGFASCHWGQLQVGRQPAPAGNLSASIVGSIADIEATPRKRHIAQVTLVGAS